MRASSFYPSKYLKASDLQGREVRVVISHVDQCEVGDDTKPVLFFEGKNKGLVLNKTNATNIGDAYGDETDEWAGQVVILYEARTDFQGRTVPCIRVRAPERGPRRDADDVDDFGASESQQQVKNRPSRTRKPAMAGGDLDDEIPF